MDGHSKREVLKIFSVWEKCYCSISFQLFKIFSKMVISRDLLTQYL